MEPLTLESLNRRLLWRNCLTDRMRGQNAPVRVADACCGIQSQAVGESLSAFWARIDGFEDEDVVSQMRPGGGLVRTWAIRSAMHTVPSQDYHIYVHGGASERMLKWIDTLARKEGYPPRDERRRWFYEPILEEIRGASVTKQTLRDLVDARAGRRGLKEGVWSGLGEMAFLGLLVHAGKEGSRSLWMRSDDWIPGLPGPPDRTTCRVELLRKYLAGYGPVSREDIRYWAYLTKKQLEEALSLLADELVEVEAAGAKEPLLALEGSLEEENAPPPPKVILLPKYDSLLLALKDKSRFMDMAHYKEVFPRIPVGMVRATVLVDGFVVASWARPRGNAAAPIEVQPFEKISQSDRRAVEERFEEYAEYAGLEGTVEWMPAP